MKTYIKKTLDTHGDGKRSKNIGHIRLPKKQTVRWRLAYRRFIRDCSQELHLWKEREGFRTKHRKKLGPGKTQQRSQSTKQGALNWGRLVPSWGGAKSCPGRGA